MPNLGDTPERKKFELSGKKGSGSPKAEEPARKKAAPATPPPRPPRKPSPQTRPVRTTLLDEDEDDGDEDEDEIIQASMPANKGQKMDPKIIGICCAVVAVIVVMAFLLLSGKEEPAPVTPKPTEDTTPSQPEPEKWGNDNLGIQDITQDTNWKSDSPLSNPDGFVEDIDGLTTRVDYTVSAIQSNVIDFVSYTKKRGTWGGGLELYWLDCTYKDNQYVVQVPFKYYKELDDTGIVPVKMEVLYIKEANGDTLSIISYMSLDEETIKTIIKSKNK